MSAILSRESTVRYRNHPTISGHRGQARMPYREWKKPIPSCPKCRAADALPRAVEAFSGSLFVEVRCDRCGHEWEISEFLSIEPSSSSERLWRRGGLA